MGFGEVWFFYGSSVFAVIRSFLNIVEIIFIIKILKKENRYHNKHRTSLFLLLNLSVSGLCSVGITVILTKILTYLAKYDIINYKGIIYQVLMYFSFVFH